jgi:hypothetical protein
MVLEARKQRYRLGFVNQTYSISSPFVQIPITKGR